MNATKDKFYTQLIRQEIAKSRKHGCWISVPIQKRGMPHDEATLHSILQQKEVEIPEFLFNIYKDVQKIELYWQLSETEGKDTSHLFTTDPWLIDNYLNEDYTWDFLKYYFTGSLFLPPIETLLGGNQNSGYGYHTVSKHMGIRPETLYPIDMNERYVSVLKQNDNKIENRVWLLDMDGRKIHDMGISVEAYFDLAYTSKLLFGWPSVFILKKNSEHYEFMKRYSRKLFPHLDLDLKEFGISF